MSEFGKGYAYCLGLFLAHAERVPDMKTRYKGLAAERPFMWFNAAADHLYELEIPAGYDDERRAEITTWQHNCIKMRMADMHGLDCTWEAVEAALQDAKDLLREYDNFNGIATEKGDFE